MDQTSPSIETPLRRFITGAFFVIIAATTAHLIFSPYGFNPTDDGFTLAYSRRILDGQVPHRDFITIRPAGSPLLHIPELLLGGSYAIWLSRYFVWIQFACFSWFWTVILTSLFKLKLGLFEKILFAAVIMTLSSHSFAIMAWHSIDGIFLASLGIMICLGAGEWKKSAGYFVLGLSYLCKQNFLLVPFAVLVILGDFRKIRFWVAAMIPGILYFLFLLFAGAWPDALLQLRSQSVHLRTVGIFTYLSNPNVPWGILVGFLLFYMFQGEFGNRGEGRRKNIRSLAGMMVLFLYLLLLARSMRKGYRVFARYPSFSLFGIAVGASLYHFLRAREKRGRIAAGCLVLFTAWSASISFGYNTPALLAGPLAAFILFSIRVDLPATEPRKIERKLYPIFLSILFLFCVGFWWMGRSRVVYRDKSLRQLTYSLDGVFPGAKKIKTCDNTFALLADLNHLTEKLGEREFCIIPDFASFWIKSKRSNPLSIDWVQATELNKKSLTNRIIGELEKGRGRLTVIAQKYTTDVISTRKEDLLMNDHYEVVRYIRNHWEKTGDTEFFELYE